jgi:hypothetical protein
VEDVQDSGSAQDDPAFQHAMAAGERVIRRYARALADLPQCQPNADESDTMAFSNDDQGYAAWVQQNPRGYVLVSWNPPRVDYTTVHRADCYSINPTQATHVQNWTAGYVKVCAPSPEALDQWARDVFGTAYQGLHHCKHCERAGRL